MKSTLKTPEISDEMDTDLQATNKKKRTFSQHQKFSIAPDSSSSQISAEPSEELDLTDLQKQMLRIIKENGGSASHSIITEEVQKLWKKMRKRDGTRYTTECKRAIASTLGNTSSSSPLFEKDLSKSTETETWWKFGPRALSLDLDFEAIKNSLSDEEEGNNIKNTNPDSEEEEEIVEPPPTKRRRSSSDRQLVEQYQAELENNKQPSRKNRRETQYSPPLEPIPRPFLSRRRLSTKLSEDHSESSSRRSNSPETSKASPSEEHHELTDLQKLMIEAICANNGSCNVDTIVNYVSKYWGSIRRRDGSAYGADYKKAVKASLSYNTSPHGPTFERDSKLKGNWKITSKALARLSPKKDHEEEEDSLHEQNLDESFRERSRERSPILAFSRSSSPLPTKLTEMHEVLMKIILSHGGVCTFEEVFEDVMILKNKNFKAVKQLGNDVKRALLASLSHNPPGNFIKTKDGSWTVAPKAMLVAKQLVEENENLSLDKIEKIKTT